MELTLDQTFAGCTGKRREEGRGRKEEVRRGENPFWEGNITF
jgi:hypothetical protein